MISVALISFFLQSQASPLKFNLENRHEATKQQASLLLNTFLQAVSPNSLNEAGGLELIEDPEIGMVVWERRLEASQRYLRWFPKGVIALQTMAGVNSNRPSISGELRHSKAEAQVVVDSIYNFLGVPKDWMRLPESGLNSRLHPTTTISNRRYYFDYGYQPVGHMYFHPLKNLSAVVNADSLEIEEFSWSDWGQTEVAKILITKENAISLAAKSHLIQGSEAVTPQIERAGLTYILPIVKDGQRVSVENVKLRVAYLVPFSRAQIFVDAETGELIREAIVK